MNIHQLNNTLSITELLAKEGILPAHKKSSDWWYISPIRMQESTASFKVNTKINRWYDHGTGEGGKLFDLALRLFPSLNSNQIIQKLQNDFSFQHHHSEITMSRPVRPVFSSFADEKKKIRVVSAGPISSPPLVNYLGLRKISVALAQVYCREVQYELYGKHYYAIGFANDAGGFELRNPYFKGSSSPKSSTFLDKEAHQITVFEGFFNFLSYITLHQNQDLPVTNFLILNSLSFFEKNRQVMEKHRAINLYLDRDNAGKRCTDQALKSSAQYKDCSIHYQDCKDLNQWLIQNFLLEQKKTNDRIITEETPNKQITRGQGRSI